MRLQQMCRACFLAVVLASVMLPCRWATAELDAPAVLRRIAIERGIAVVVEPDSADLPIRLAQSSDLLVYVQTNDLDKVSAIRRAADKAGLLGIRVYVEHGLPSKIHLAPNLADALIATDTTHGNFDNPPRQRELHRVLHPGAKALVGDQIITVPRRAGMDDWSHPYHGPDNNPQSGDLTATAPYLTQFLCDPWYVPMPQVTVASGGRVFKVLGHIAQKQREWPWLNTLLAVNGYNGTHLWKRPLKPGFMIHRNTVIATPNTLYLADDQSCKLLSAATGKVRDEITIPRDIDTDGVWKWMAFQDNVLYALVGTKEIADADIKGRRTQPGWPWSGLGPAYGGEYQWGFGRTLLAIEPDTKRVKWTYSSKTPIDSRAMCMSDGRIYVYSNQHYLACVSATSGEELWKTKDAEVLEALGRHDRAQTASKGFASTSYAKANQHGVYFAGPQRTRIVAVSADDGSLMWSYPHGNFQLVLRSDGLYALGRTQTSKVFNYMTGQVLADLECYRGNCTRATGTVDSIFTRGYRHTGTMRLDLSQNQARRIPLMRPACQDGVIVSDGQLYWGPWMCDCNHSLIGMIALASARGFEFGQQATESERLEVVSSPDATPSNLSLQAADWPAYRAGPRRRASSLKSIPTSVKELWQYQPPASVEATAPIAVGDRVVWSGLDGTLRAVDAASGRLRWSAYTGGSLRFPPEFFGGRIYAGSGDGVVYCFEASTGRTLWRFRAAPENRKITVHGRLLSNWPVGSGVLVSEGIVYAAAGITSYDGTHVYALDAETGGIIWQNNTSGRLVINDQVTGVSVQGHLLLHEDRLYLAGGNVVSPAAYDLENGQCLNELGNEWWKRPDDASEKFPSRPKSSMFHRSPRGRELFVVDGEVKVFDQLLYSPPQYGPSRYFGGHFLQAESEEVAIRASFGRVVRMHPEKSKDGKLLGVWQNSDFADPRALAVCQNVVIVTGVAVGKGKETTYLVSALSLKDGQPIWTQELPGEPVSWGLAVDRDGRVIVTLRDGRVVCYGG